LSCSKIAVCESDQDASFVRSFITLWISLNKQTFNIHVHDYSHWFTIKVHTNIQISTKWLFSKANYKIALVFK